MSKYYHNQNIQFTPTQENDTYGVLWWKSAIVKTQQNKIKSALFCKVDFCVPL